MSRGIMSVSRSKYGLVGRWLYSIPERFGGSHDGHYTNLSTFTYLHTFLHHSKDHAVRIIIHRFNGTRLEGC